MRSFHCGSIENGPILGRIQQAPAFAESRGCRFALSGYAHKGSPASGRQALAAFRTTAAEYQAAVLGGHAGAEAVGALALQDAGLKCSLHDSVPVGGNK